MVLGTRSLSSSRYLLGESLERKYLLLKVTNECWKLFLKNMRKVDTFLLLASSTKRYNKITNVLGQQNILVI
jgi:hypothetical protein